VNFLFTVFVFICLITIPSASSYATPVHDGAVLTEDATWRGSIVIRGSIVVAPHATLRIEPGTVVRFAASAGQQLPSLVVQGRLHVAGTSERPIVLKSDHPVPTRGSWAGIVFLSTEKNNLLEGCRIENADTGIDIRFSTVTLKSVSILHAQTALLSHDGIVQMSDSTVSDSATGIEIYDSEFDGSDVTVDSCQRGCVLSKSSVVMASPKIMNNQQAGLETDECRIKITGGEFYGNALGAHIKGGEGEISMSRFLRNRQTAMHLSGSRLKIQRCRFAENSQDALRIEDSRVLVMNNAFSFNGGFNLFNAGSEVVDARLNWWGGVDPSLVRQKIHDAFQGKNTGTVKISPWLNEMPMYMP
jgi:hypothetical protein